MLDNLTRYTTTMIEGQQLYASNGPESELSEKIEQATELMRDDIVASVEVRFGKPATQP